MQGYAAAISQSQYKFMIQLVDGWAAGAGIITTIFDLQFQSPHPQPEEQHSRQRWLLALKAAVLVKGTAGQRPRCMQHLLP